VLLPVLIGMLIRRWRPAFAQRMDKPVRIGSAVILALVIVGAVISNLELLLDNFAALAGITTLFCALSLTIGYFVPRMFKVTERESIATAFEVGIHNATLAIVVAQSVLLSTEMSLPAAIYGVLMFFIAAGFGFLIKRRADRTAEAAVPV
jgi:BASS family bile acid:Na+ symporter